MKKITSICLAIVLVFSLCSVFVAAKGSVNLAQGEGVTLEGAPKYQPNYAADLLDNLLGDDKYANWAGFYNNADNENNNYDGKNGIIVMDLGKVYANIDSIEAHIWDAKGTSGIASPAHIYVSVSSDGVNYVDLGELTFSTDAIGWATLALSTPVNARFVKYNFDKGSNGGVFMFVSELAVWGDGSEASAPVEDKVINLLAQEGTVTVTNCSTDDLSYTLDANGFKVNCHGTDWPNAYLKFNTPVTVNVADAYLEIEATVTGGRSASIRLMGPVDDAGAIETDDIYLQQFDADITLDNGGDAPTGSTVSYKLPVSELAYCIYDSANAYAGKNPITTEEITFSGLQVFSCGEGCVVDITKLNLIVPGTPSVPVIKEEITVDGDVNDTGWAKDKWINVSGENGSWQYPTKKEVAEGTPVPTFTYKHQLRADDEKLYGALVLDGVHEEEKNIKVRIWFRDNDEATRYTSFYDFVLAPDGTLTTLGKYNLALDDNKGCYIGQTDPTVQEYIGSLDAKAVAADGKTVFEFSVDIDEVTADGNFDYFVSLERKQGVNTGTLYYPFVPELNETSPHGNYPWLLWYAENDATVEVEDIVLGEVVVSDKEEADTSMMGTAPADPAFTVDLDVEGGWVAGEKLVVTATVDILADIDLSQVLFNLYYDASDVEIVLPEELGDIITTGKDSWKEDSLFTLKTEGDYGVIECAPATTVEEDVLKKGEQLVMTFEFTVKEDAEGLINFQLSNKGLVGYSWDLDAAEAAGAGSSLAVENADELGDTGIYVIAALALVALIGTAVVIKKRA